MTARNDRILIVDDNRAIHEDYQKILVRPKPDVDLSAVEGALFDQSPPVPRPGRLEFSLTFAFQGEEAVALARTARTEGAPFALAFVDVRMPPGIDGIETAQRLWAIDPDLQVVICSAYADYSWTEMTEQLGSPDRWVILKKPFDNIEVLQLAHALAEKWALQQRSKAHVDDLEKRVAARTADLEAALQRLRDETAERLRGEEERRIFERKMEETQRLEGLGVLAGGVAHDFNNILTGVLVSASLARMEATPGTELHNHLQMIEENSRRAAGLCEQLLTYAGRSRVTTSAQDVNVLIRETLELLHISVPKDADFSADLADKVPPIKGDPARLRQVVMNLVLNAAEALAAPPRRIRLASGCRRLDAAALKAATHPGEAKPGEYVFIEVSDTGTGMSPETMRRIFEPFFTTKFTGRGLGLCAVLGIMRNHGGVLDVQSEPGRGTTFRIYFPALEIVPEVASPAPVEMPRTAAGTVLVADDEESVRMAAAATLRRQGFTVMTACDGAEAVAVAEATSVPLAGVLLDVTMPRMDGPTALLAIRQVQPRVPVLLMTGYDAGDVASRVSGLSGVTLVQKPFTVADLVRHAHERFAAPARIDGIAARAPVARPA
jgi:signal transduction histidine kinase